MLDELGAGVSMPLADEWFAAHLVGSRSAADVPLHPLAAAHEWMKARGQAIVNALSAQPLPWEDGHDGCVLDHWLARLGVPEPTTPALRVALVCHHRLSEAARQVLRDLQIAGLSVAQCAERRGLSPGAVEDLYREGRLASARALERLQGGAHDATDPHAVSSATVRRALEGAGPSLATQLQALTAEQRAGAGPLLQPTLELVERTEASKAWALQAGAREGARLLYEAARTCLAAHGRVRDELELYVEPQPLAELQGAACSLGRRLSTLRGRQAVVWPAGRHAFVSSQLAEECLRLAEVLLPDWPWTRFLGAMSAASQAREREALPVLDRLMADGLTIDESLRPHLARNAAWMALEIGDASRASHDLASLQRMAPHEPATAFLALRVAALSRNRTLFDQACGQFRASGAAGSAYWVCLFNRDAAEWARGLDLLLEDVQARLEEGAS